MVYTGDLKFPAVRLMGSSPIPDTALRKTVPAHCFLAGSGGSIPKLCEGAEPGSRVLGPHRAYSFEQT